MADIVDFGYRRRNRHIRNIRDPRAGSVTTGTDWRRTLVRGDTLTVFPHRDGFAVDHVSETGDSAAIIASAPTFDEAVKMGEAIGDELDAGAWTR
jgi:hypothetical protein